MTTKIFGHLAPDTDSTCAPIVWAWYQSTHCANPSEAILLGEPNTEAAFVLEYWNVKKPNIVTEISAETDVIIVDTNNPQELFPNINETNVTQIIDHHKLTGGIETKAPIEITIRPLACTTTVMYELMPEKIRGNLPREIAGLMLSAILSDTLEFRSPTTTDTDREVAEVLATQLDLDISAYATEMFAAKSDVSAFSAEELIRMDSKKYAIGATNFRISVLETTDPEAIMQRKDEILKAMESVKSTDGVDEILFFVVDILNESSTLFVPNGVVKSIAEKSFQVSVEGDFVLLPGVVSRKKQVIPALKV